MRQRKPDRLKAIKCLNKERNGRNRHYWNLSDANTHLKNILYEVLPDNPLHVAEVHYEPILVD